MTKMCEFTTKNLEKSDKCTTSTDQKRTTKNAENFATEN